MAEALSSLSSRHDAHTAGRVLFVDDDADVLKAAALLLGRHGLSLTAARDPLEARSRMAAEPVDVVLLDLNFARGATDGEEGFRCLQQLLADDPRAVVVVVTGHSGIAVAVRAMQAGATDFVMKPWNNARLLATVQAGVELRRRRTARSDDAGVESEAEPAILGESPAIERVRGLVARAGPTAASVLILGGAGLGKSLVARRLHLASGRRGPLVTLDVSALTAEEAERALFGDRLGSAAAWTEAEGGTLVLDEVADLPPALQGRLAAMLEQASASAPRLIATSRRARTALQARGGLRDALFYRLNTAEIALPALAERGRDAVLLLEHYLRLFARRHGRPEPRLSDDAVEAVLAAPWPGGVRTLQQTAERCVLFGEGSVVAAADLGLGREDRDPEDRAAPTLVQSERTLIAAALKRHGFNVSHAARDLGLTRATLYRRMAKHGF